MNAMELIEKRLAELKLKLRYLDPTTQKAHNTDIRIMELEKLKHDIKYGEVK